MSTVFQSNNDRFRQETQHNSVIWYIYETKSTSPSVEMYQTTISEYSLQVYPFLRIRLFPNSTCLNWIKNRCDKSSVWSTYMHAILYKYCSISKKKTAFVPCATVKFCNSSKFWIEFWFRFWNGYRRTRIGNKAESVRLVRSFGKSCP